MHLAETSIFLSIASLLYVFDITKARTEDGKEIEPEVEYDGFIRYVVLPRLDMNGGLMTMWVGSHPKPFGCRLVPRSREVERLVMQSLKVGSQEEEV